MFINTAVTNRVNAPLYRIKGAGYLVVIYVRDARGKFTEVDRHTGTRSSVVSARNASLSTYKVA